MCWEDEKMCELKRLFLIKLEAIVDEKVFICLQTEEVFTRLHISSLF